MGRAAKIYTTWLSGASAPPNPSAILGSNLDLHIDGASTTNKTLTGSPVNYISSLNSDDPNAHSFTNSGIAKAAHNGRFMTVFDGVGLAYNSLSRWNYLHNGLQDYTVGGRFNP